MNYLTEFTIFTGEKEELKFELTISVVIGTDCIGSCKSNYHTITAMTAPSLELYA
jgi:hypothetical protein